MKKYREVPWWWYFILVVLAFFAGRAMSHGADRFQADDFYGAGLIVVLKGETTLPWWSYIVALISGGRFILSPFTS